VDVSAGEKVTIHLNSGIHYFNITNYASFENIIFDGINGLAVMNNGENEAVYTPKKVCELASKITINS